MNVPPNTTKQVTKHETGKEFDFTRADFERVRGLIYERAGISLADSKQEMVYSRLARRLRANGIASFASYLDALEAGRMPAEWESFTNALTTNLTSFFREAHHFPLLAEHALKARAAHGGAPWRPRAPSACSASSGKWWASRKNDVRFVVSAFVNDSHSAGMRPASSASR